MDRGSAIVVIIATISLSSEVAHGGSRTSSHVTRCITSCDGKAAGHYSSCLGCEFWATCHQGTLYDGNECPPDTLWSDATRSCDIPFYVTCAEGSDRPIVPESEPIPGQPVGANNEGTPSDEPQLDSNEIDNELSTKPNFNNIKLLPDPTTTSDFDRCLVWIIMCLIAVGLLFLLSIYHFCYVRFGHLCKRKTKMVDAYTHMSYREPSIASSAPAYDDVIENDMSQRYVPLPYAVGPENNSVYQEIFPIYEELDSYRERYLTLHGYTYLQLAQHVGNDVIRREIARSVGPMYLTLCHQHETCPKAYEVTQDRMRELVHNVWRESPSAQPFMPKTQLKVAPQ